MPFLIGDLSLLIVLFWLFLMGELTREDTVPIFYEIRPLPMACSAGRLGWIMSAETVARAEQGGIVLKYRYRKYLTFSLSAGDRGLDGRNRGIEKVKWKPKARK